MARGWESKGIEAQQEQSANDQGKARTAPVTPEELARRAKQATLALARARAAADLGRARTAAHRQMLERALAELDRQQAELGAQVERGPKPDSTARDRTT
jgi:hypothetical protein